MARRPRGMPVIEVPPPDGYGPDHLDLAARQVRLPGGVPHGLARSGTAADGRVYDTHCKATLRASEGAMLTTREATCRKCTGKGNASASGSPGQPLGDHPHSDPGDGRTECERCGKFVWLVTHSCKGVPVTEAAKRRRAERQSGADS